MDFIFPQQLIIPAVLLGVLGVFLLVCLARLRFKKNNYTEAVIDRITPHFKEQSPLKTLWLRCSYIFTIGKTEHSGECILPLGHFLKTVIPPGPIIVYDVRINMPVLISDEARLVGEENIEHYLLQHLEKLKIRYLVRDPSTNSLADLEGLKKRTIKTRPGGK